VVVKNDDSGEVMLILTRDADLLVPMIRLCDQTRHEGLNGQTQLEKWPYSQMLQNLGMEIEKKEAFEPEIGQMMLENARKMGLYQKILEIPPQAKRLANERNLKLVEWELTGLLNSLGQEIEKMTGSKYPVKRDEQYYADLYG